MEKVTLTKESFGKRSLFTPRVVEMEVPELNALMDLGDGQVAIIKIQQLDFAAFLKHRGDAVDYAQNLIEGVIDAAVEKGKVKSEVLDIWDKMSPEVRYRIGMVEECIIDPKLNRSDIIFLSKMFPLVISRIATKILEITNEGAELKKNS